MYKHVLYFDAIKELQLKFFVYMVNNMDDSSLFLRHFIGPTFWKIESFKNKISIKTR
jgi:hypothetical protein